MRILNNSLNKIYLYLNKIILKIILYFKYEKKV